MFDMKGNHHIFDVDVDTLKNQQTDPSESQFKKKPSKSQFQFKINNFDDRFIIKIYGRQKPNDASEASDTQYYLNESNQISVSLD